MQLSVRALLLRLACRGSLAVPLTIPQHTGTPMAGDPTQTRATGRCRLPKNGLSVTRKRKQCLENSSATGETRGATTALGRGLSCGNRAMKFISSIVGIMRCLKKKLIILALHGKPLLLAP